MEATSLSLLQRLRQRDDDPAWQRFDRVYRPLIARWLRQARLEPADADDLAQEVMLVVVRKVAEFEHAGRPGAFRHWLRQVVGFVLRDRWRSRQRRGETRVALGEPSDQLADPNSELSQYWDREHDGQVLRQLLDLLADEFNPTTLRAFERLALEQAQPEDVAQELGLSVGAVYIAKSRVLRRLREEATGLLDDLP
ncbi:MAG TPA: sigma-70 family RNA polymerase sigma factor [Gemmatales bacterium]|nr:sigma-70 family RNA polymerase sigma factor [Gemmatales bacterium]